MSEQNAPQTLRACQDCTAQISARAVSCPQCGAPGPLLAEAGERRGAWLRWAAVIVFIVGEFTLLGWMDQGVRSAQAGGEDPPFAILLASFVTIILGIVLMVKYLKTPASAWARLGLSILAVPVGLGMGATVIGRVTALGVISWVIAIVIGGWLLARSLAIPEQTQSSADAGERQ